MDVECIRRGFLYQACNVGMVPKLQIRHYSSTFFCLKLRNKKTKRERLSLVAFLDTFCATNDVCDE